VGRRQKKGNSRRGRTKGIEEYFLVLLFKEDIRSVFGKKMCPYPLP
jgi:hypothetical protein